MARSSGLRWAKKARKLESRGSFPIVFRVDHLAYDLDKAAEVYAHLQLGDSPSEIRAGGHVYGCPTEICVYTRGIVSQKRSSHSDRMRREVVYLCSSDYIRTVADV